MAIPPPPGPQQPEGQYPPPGTPPTAPGVPPGTPGMPPGAYPYPQQTPYPAAYPAPYQPWGQGYSPYNSPAPVNGLAISALVLGILCFLPAVGLVLGIVALAQIKKRGERGKGMAVGGMVMSSIGVVLVAVMVATGGARDFWDGFRDAANDSGSSDSAFSLSKGECFDAPGGSLEGVAYDVDKVPCAGKHDAEVFADYKMSGGSYPGDGAVTDAADKKCYALADTYAMDAWAVPENVDVYYFTPTSQSWRLGDREVTCLFGNTDAKGSLSGSLRNDGTTLDVDQLAYLNAAHGINAAMDAAPDEEYVEDDLPGHKKWATKMSDTLTEQADALRRHTFAPAAAKRVAVLVKDMELSQKEWAQAAKAKDADTFYAHYEKGMKLIDPKKTVTTRKALGLATTPPAYDESGGGDSGGEGGTGAEV
ncbi:MULTISPECIES: DUF4190 domain-containing protein [unclassified Streptomyces]|uniref:DUF4190 domain-containing protein n=1 Tax=unclassified Streptomyces TaxID=2593676 RepID=UPI002E820674|nr:DUF4190 domain-containing protein [Streptomyces sp. NBC_00589]WTI36530.1 DUF4190 domain-containing protein [Streptomyces sp. NBC_00775]WUB29794.1 DUF4190 domain-containing protein [Streptomyces sp. NBC_00589]